MKGVIGNGGRITTEFEEKIDEFIEKGKGW